MKRLLKALLCAACVWGTFATTGYAGGSQGCHLLVVEDVDLDGEVTAVDSLAVLRVAVGLDSATELYVTKCRRGQGDDDSDDSDD